MFDTYLDRDLIESKSLLGRECDRCNRILPWRDFQKDNTYREGRRSVCLDCESSPRLSTREHVARLRESNYNSEAVKKQRWENQEEYENSEARRGRVMTHSDFLLKLLPLVPDLYITEGRVAGDLAMFRVYPQPQKRLDGQSFEYVGFCPTGWLPEYSTYDIDPVRDVIIREKERGWRSLLLRLIINSMITEEDAHRVFGPPIGAGSVIYQQKLQQWRNQK